MEARIQSIGRAGALIEAMGQGEWVPLRDLADRLGIAKTTTRNLVGALVDIGLVDHDAQYGAYRLGLSFLAYGKAVERRLDIAATIRPHLIRLCAQTRETVNLALPCPTDAIIVESLEGSQSLRVSSYSGTRACYHSTACGRALLAWQPESLRRTIFELGPLAAATPHTITDIGELETALEESRQRGWAIEIEENEVGSACVAAPILGSDGTAVAAVSIAGPVARFNPDIARQYGELLVRQLNEIGTLPGQRHHQDRETAFLARAAS